MATKNPQNNKILNLVLRKVLQQYNANSDDVVDFINLSSHYPTKRITGVIPISYLESSSFQPGKPESQEIYQKLKDFEQKQSEVMETMLDSLTFATNEPVPNVNNAADIVACHINTQYGKGGAAQSMQTFVEQLQKTGMQSTILTAQIHSEEVPDNLAQIPVTESQALLAKEMLSRLSSPDDLFVNPLAVGMYKHDYFRKANLVHIHNIHGQYMSLYDLRKIAQQKPLIWSIRDGLMLFQNKSDLITEQTAKPALGEMDPWPDLSDERSQEINQKFKDILHDQPILLVPVSNWIKQKLQKSQWAANFDIEVIYNGVDTNTFKPKDKQEARAKTKLDPDKKIILMVADHGLANPWKGADHFKQIVARLGDKYQFVIVGAANNVEELPGLIQIGYASQSDLINYYLSADLYLHTALFDALPRTCIEAQACGLPVIAYSTGGVPEIVADKETGYIVDYKDLEGMINQIDEFFAAPETHASLSKAARNRAETLFDLSVQTKKLAEVYLNQIKKWHQQKSRS